MNYSLLIEFSIIIVSIALINTVFPQINYFIQNKTKLKKLQYGITSRQDIFDLESRTAEKVLKNLLIYEGYSHVEPALSQDKGDIGYTAMLHDDKVYIAYSIVDTMYMMDNKKSAVISKEEDIPKVELKELRKFLGRMVHDGIRKGIYITNGNFSNEAIKFAEGISDRYEIVLYDGMCLTKEIAALKNNYNPKGELIYG